MYKLCIKIILTYVLHEMWNIKCTFVVNYILLLIACSLYYSCVYICNYSQSAYLVGHEWAAHASPIYTPKLIIYNYILI